MEDLRSRAAHQHVNHLEFLSVQAGRGLRASEREHAGEGAGSEERGGSVLAGEVVGRKEEEEEEEEEGPPLQMMDGAAAAASSAVCGLTFLPGDRRARYWQEKWWEGRRRREEEEEEGPPLQMMDGAAAAASCSSTLGLVLQNENFNYNRYTNYIMDSWSSTWMLDIQAQTQPGGTTSPPSPCCMNKPEGAEDAQPATVANNNNNNNNSGMFKTLERLPISTSPELGTEMPANLMKMLADGNNTGGVPTSSHLQDVQPTGRGDLPGDQRRGETPAVQTRPYADPFCEEQSSPIYSDSYSSSPPERYRSEFQFALGAPAATPYKSSELPMVYLNKGQFYPITLQGIDNTAGLTATKVKTVVMAVFENDKWQEEEEEEEVEEGGAKRPASQAAEHRRRRGDE
ncbi:hypothetical protein CRUP_014512 [Coryphaenoides rupestris]|nr:hypothetical protein CRUP_014512 [Coryphaenoides rupestris]